MDPETLNSHSWSEYGRRQLGWAYMPPIPRQLQWGPWEGVGPGDEALGDITGKRLLDIGSGAGHYAVHLARTYGARIDAVEASPTQHKRAVTHHQDTASGVTFIHDDVVDHLQRARPYDGAYGISSLPYLDPHRSLPALHAGLRPGAPLVFSALHTNFRGDGPLTTCAPRREDVLLRDSEPIPVSVWVLASDVWNDLLTEHGFDVDDITLLTAPDDANLVVYQLVRARRAS